MINKNNLLVFTVLFFIFLPGFAGAEKSESVPVESGLRQDSESKRQSKERVGSRDEHGREQVSGKMDRFEVMRRRYQNDAAISERPVYRRSKGNPERPANRYEDFEQKRERHRKYNEFIEQKNIDKPVDQLNSGAKTIYPD